MEKSAAFDISFLGKSVFSKWKPICAVVKRVHQFEFVLSLHTGNMDNADLFQKANNVTPVPYAEKI